MEILAKYARIEVRQESLEQDLLWLASRCSFTRAKEALRWILSFQAGSDQVGPVPLLSD